MLDIKKTKGTNGFSLVSTFSGAGGSCLGFEMAGFETLYANEFIEEARNTYALNHENVYIDGRDIREVTGKFILDKFNLSLGDLDVLEGSPPCSSFSMAGKREEKWGVSSTYSDTAHQVTDNLFFEFIRLLTELQPKVFIAENVKGLIQGKAKGYFIEILKAFKIAGYQVEVRLINASWLGVPQSRQRVFFVGVRNDLVKKFGVAPVFPEPLKYRYAIKDAINMYDSSLIDFETDESIELKSSVGDAWEQCKVGEKSSKYFSLYRSNPNFPVGTITASAGGSMASVTHPYYKRKFNLKEARALSGFPEDFELTGTFSQRFERLGRSVVPLVSFAIAQRIRDDILKITNA